MLKGRGNVVIGPQPFLKQAGHRLSQSHETLPGRPQINKVKHLQRLTAQQELRRPE